MRAGTRGGQSPLRTSEWRISENQGHNIISRDGKLYANIESVLIRRSTPVLRVADKIVSNKTPSIHGFGIEMPQLK